MSDPVTAFAPASIGNVGVGFDMLGLALAGGAGDRVIATRSDTPGISIAEVRGLDGEIHPYLSSDPKENTASIAAQALWDAAGATENTQDMIVKGRRRKASQVARGEDVTLSKLTEEMVRAMRAEPPMTFKELGAKYGVSPGTANKVILRQTWTHID